MFNFKEVETLGAKAGVVLNTIKEVLQSLVDDNLVDSDKIGAGVYFWAFPSKAAQAKIQELEQAQTDLHHLQTTRKRLNQEIANQLEEKPESEERMQKLDKLAELTEKLEELKKEREVLKVCSRSYYDECVNENKTVVKRANVWTDNIWNMQDWLMKKNPGLSLGQLQKHFSIPADLDDLQE